MGEDSELDHIAEFCERLSEGIGVEECNRRLAAAHVGKFGYGAVGVDAGRNVAEYPDLLLVTAGHGEAVAEPGNLRGSSGRVGLAGAGLVSVRHEDIVEHDHASVLK